MAPNHPRGRAARVRTSESGFALIASLLVLMLTAILAVTYFTVTTGERTQSANVHVARSSLYAADAGVRAEEQWLANYGKTKLDSLANFQSGTNPLIPSPNTFFPVGTWNAATVTATNPGYTASATLSFFDTTLSDTAQSYDYLFTITSTGTRGTYGKRVVQSQGILRVSASRGSFADYLLFTKIHTMADGSNIWFTSSSTFDGRLHTNDEFKFAYHPTFQDLVTSVDSKAWYYNGGSPVERAANSYGSDVPNFFGGFTRGVQNITLPANSFNQQNAALGPPLDPSSSTQPTNTQIRQALGLSGSTAPPSGVYLPHSGSALTGGIYVQGNLSQCLMKQDASGNQVYVLKQGSSTDTVRVNRSTGHTYFYDASSGTTSDYTGVPPRIIYTVGDVLDLRGPDRVSGVPPPALANGTQLLVAGTGDIVLQRDITCANFDTGNNVLGLYTAGGAVRIGTGAPNDMNLDAYVMATHSSSGDFEVDNYDSGSPRGTFHLRGGSVTTYYGAFFTFNQAGTLQTGYARDFHYDARGLVPPYYPLTPRMDPDVPSARTLSWKEM